ncbi:MAG: prepilin-type N-terminal cleavage/methylation domain-containing protein [Verrucomicrobiota bacterium]
MRKGFSLIEVIAAVAVFAIFAGGIALSLSFIARSQEKIHQDTIIASIAENLRVRLESDADFPFPQTQSFGNAILSTNFFYDYEGEETSFSQAMFKTEILLKSSQGYSSSRLDEITLNIYQIKNNSLLSTFHLQRAHRRPRL